MDKAFEAAKAKALIKSEDGCAYHVNAILVVIAGHPMISGYTISDWYDGTTLATFSNGREL